MVEAVELTTTRLGNISWPVRVSHVRDSEYEIFARGTSYQIVIMPRIYGVLVSITNWNRCGYLNFNREYNADDICYYLDINQDDAAFIAAGLNEIMKNEVLQPPVVQNFERQRQAVRDKLRWGLL
ncbi:MAG TPA: hypothetical protein DEF34_10270 [Desulfotomaculum sp.]|nr:MAG: hypothetical protein JL56_05785 [Desulfotomaculum sp. BICA1-6]HBX23999.1 hypothetical protein [Desulfotomaculum sp.]